MASNFNFIKKKTTKEKDYLVVEKFKYYFKPPINKDGSSRFVCAKSDCSASITIILVAV